MIRQDDSRLRKEINKWGCYYMCILYFANKYVGWEHSIADIDSNYYKEFRLDGWMDRECTILRPDAIFGYFGLVTRIKIDEHHKHKQPPHVMCRADEFEVLLWHNPKTGFGHFTAGNGTGIRTYDPLGESNTATHGYLESKRIFRML